MCPDEATTTAAECARRNRRGTHGQRCAEVIQRAQGCVPEGRGPAEADARQEANQKDGLGGAFRFRFYEPLEPRRRQGSGVDMTTNAVADAGINGLG